MASSIGGDFGLERPDPLPQYSIEPTDADATLRLPAADRTFTDLSPVHPDVADYLVRSEAETLDSIDQSDAYRAFAH